MKPFKDVIDGIRKAVMASEVREDIAQMGEYVEQFANTAGENIQKAIDPTLSLSGKAADAKATGDAVGELKEDLDVARSLSGFKYTATQSKTTEHEFKIYPNRYYKAVFTGESQITAVLYKQQPYDSNDSSNIKLVDTVTLLPSTSVNFKTAEQYNYLHIWQNNKNTVNIEIEEMSNRSHFIDSIDNQYGKQSFDFLSYNTKPSYNNIDVLTKGKSVIFVCDVPVQDLIIRLCEEKTYNENSTSLLTVADGYTGTSFISDVIQLDKDYNSLVTYCKTVKRLPIKVYEINSILADTTIKVNKMISAGVEEITPTWSQYWFDAGGNTGTILHTDGVASEKLQKNGFYLVTFPDDLTVEYNVKRYENEELRRNITSPYPFSIIINNDYLRLCVKRKDGGTLLPGDKLLLNVKIYCVHKELQYGTISVAPFDATEAKKETATLILNGSNDTDILSAIFGCYDSINVLLYNGTYSIDKMWTYSDTAKISLPFNNYNFDGGANFRRYISICGESPSTLQTLGSVRLYVTQKLHESLQDSGVNYFVIGTPYNATSDAIGRMGTSCVLKNINIIGYGYDKPITYVDTTRCLSTMIESVNIRSWAAHIDGYSAFDNTPNQECCGIRVGRGSNYGIQNFVKHLNVWYCGKGIACNGEHFIFEDVKTHHDYIGFVFGDKKTIGKQEHPNIMIGCSIEGCYRLMTLSKNGITTSQDYDTSLPKSTLIMIGTSTEASWTIPTNEIVDGTTKTKTLPVKEIVKNGWRGRIEIDWSGDLFESGTGEGFAISKY